MTFRFTVALVDPAMLEAWHRYAPWSSSLTALITRLLPLAWIWNRASWIGAPFLVQVWTGVGSPVAVQRRVASIPETVVTMVSAAMTTGPTAKQWR